ncbi:MAG: 4-hydroxy-tetrahydrodipicolinate synthase [Bacteroidales bacterium]|nr:4-hydroxy-tetrahydrodipicolinate synthase [Bacteroidales bacterium]
MSELFKGTGVAIITPFHDSGNIDFGSFEKIIEHIIGGGVNYIVALGTTGESVTLSRDEKVAVFEFVVEIVNKRVPVIAGLGGNNTQEVINTIKATSFDGIDAILSVCPYYNKPQQKGLYSHYKAIAGACPVPVILYNVPGRTSMNISAETTLKLAGDFNNIIGIKEASGNLLQCMEIIKDKPQDFLLISGDDALTLPLIALGADGVISVVANAFPLQFSDMVNLCLKGKFAKARTLHFDLLRFTNAIFMDGNPSGIKAAMEMIGLCKSNVRLPLVKVNKNVHSIIAEQVEILLKNQVEIN